MIRRKKVQPSQDELAARLRVLQGAELFSTASDEELRDLVRAVSVRSVRSGTDVVREGRLPTHVYVIREGRFEVISRGERGEQARAVNVLGEGDHFGEIGLIEGMPATATVRAKTEATLLEIPGREFLTFVDRSASLTEVADRISTWLARTHPSYRPSTTGTDPVVSSASRLAETLQDWDDVDVSELQAAVGRLQGLSPERRRALLRELGA